MYSTWDRISMESLPMIIGDEENNDNDIHDYKAMLTIMLIKLLLKKHEKSG